MNELKLPTPFGEITILDEPSYSFGAADNSRVYRQEINFSDGYRPSSAHGVLVDGVPFAVVGVADGTTGVHVHSAVVVEDRLFLAASNRVVCFKLKPFAFDWALETDLATCFGLHFSPERGALISHGEVLISRLSERGELLWQQGGKDIFTGELALKAAWIEVRDFNDDLHRFAYEDGASIRPNATALLRRNFQG